MPKKSETLKEVSQHYEMWDQDNEKRKNRKNGWNDITDAYYGKLPDDWPYITHITDPRIRTSIIEKNARLINNKLRGRLIPREGTDIVKAATNNAVLDYQWDTANDGGSMLTKISIADIDTRLYQSKFAFVYWKFEVDNAGNIIFDSNEMAPLDIRDCGMDAKATHVKDAKWFQVRTWEYVEDLENQTDAKGNPIFKNLDKLKGKLAEKLGRSSRRRTEYTPRVKQLRGLEDRIGEDMAYPVAKIVTEYRRDRWITFSPDYDLIHRDIPNPYKHGKIPIAQLRYYPLQDDPLGESEVEPVIPLWKAIQATICAYMDEVILKIRPPLKIIENAARVETIEYGPEAQWLVDRQDAIEEMRSSGDALAYFQTTYQSLTAAFNIAMGDLSQGTSSVDPFETEPKTATEIRATVRQQNTRDQKNQNDLGEFIKDIMMMWLPNNQQFLFSDPSKAEEIIKIVGQEQYNVFKRAGMADLEPIPGAMDMIADIVTKAPDIGDGELNQLMESAFVPKFPVILNPNEKDPTRIRTKPKLDISEDGGGADLSVTPSDMQGTYDYIPDVKSMAQGAGEELADARQQAINFLTAPNVLQLLAEQGYKPNVKDLISTTLEEIGLRDVDRYFEKIEQQLQPPGQVPGQPTIGGQANATEAGANQVGGPNPFGSGGGIPGTPQANTPTAVPKQVA